MLYENVSMYFAGGGYDQGKVDAIAEDIRQNGWHFPPILVDGEQGVVITAPHRFLALAKLRDDPEDFHDEIFAADVAEDVSDIIEAWYSEDEARVDGEFPWFNLEEVFGGTWVEEFKDGISDDEGLIRW